MKKLDEIIAGARSIALCGHVRPDGDCIGAVTAVYEYIEQNYPDVRTDCYLDEIPYSLKFLIISEDFFEIKSAQKNYDLFISLDCADMSRMGKGEEIFKNSIRTVCIDHHVSNPGYADYNIVCGEIGSSCEVIYSLMDPDNINVDIARSLYTGMVHDTGVFQYTNTTSKTLRIAADLIDYGFDFSKIIEDSFYCKTFIQNKLLGIALDKSQLILDDKCIISMVGIEEYSKIGAGRNDFEGIVSQLRYTKEPELAVLLHENEPGVWRVSMRSKGNIDLIPIATAIDGGGHKVAAGGTIYGTKKESYEKIKTEIEKAVGRQ